MENNKQSCVEWLKLTLEDYGDSENLVITWEDFDKLIEKTKEIDEDRNEIYDNHRTQSLLLFDSESPIYIREFIIEGAVD